MQQQAYDVPRSIGQRIGKVMPKTAGANTVEQIRDLEIPNEHRKVLARVFSKLIGEKATQTMPKIQQAFLPGRDISEANVAVQEAYYRAAKRGLFKFWLLLDCSKGYSNIVGVDRESASSSKSP